MTQELLWLLKRENSPGEWLATYLRVVYEHPGAELIGRFAGDALQTATQLGQTQELELALAHLLECPLDSPIKAQVRNALHRRDEDDSANHRDTVIGS